MRISRSGLKQAAKSSNTNESMLQRMVLLLRLGFSQAAVEKTIARQGGGPYIAEQHVGEAVALLRRFGFTQQQLDALLAASHAFTRTPADLEANLVWLQRQFGLQPSGLAKACTRSPALLECKHATLEANWRAFEAAFQPTAAAMAALAASLQRRGMAGCSLDLPPQTVRCGCFKEHAWHLVDAFCSNHRQVGLGFTPASCHAERRLKVGRLQRMLGLSDAALPNKIGRLAHLFSYDGDTLKASFTALQELTGGQHSGMCGCSRCALQKQLQRCCPCPPPSCRAAGWPTSAVCAGPSGAASMPRGNGAAQLQRCPGSHGPRGWKATGAVAARHFISG